MPADRGTILLTGATGYIGGLLLRRLQDADRPLRCLTRRPHKLASQISGNTEVVAGDVLDPQSLAVAMSGVETAYYLVHSMTTAEDFQALDRRAASNFAVAARHAGVARIIYLGGLGGGDDLSDHLASRHEVGRILRGSGVATIELRASIVIGSGSASFEALRDLVERLPAIPTPTWSRTAAQPIAVEDVLEYLVAAKTLDPERSAIYEIGGSDRTSYVHVMREYARLRNLRRPMIRIPLISPRASRVFLAALTPKYAQVVGAMIGSLRNATIVHDAAAREAFAIEPRGLREAIERTLAAEDRAFAETHWSEGLTPPSERGLGGVRFGRRRVSSRVVPVNRRADSAFAPIERIGGSTGWYALNWFWRLRGFLDVLRGGVGLRRGRRHPEQLQVGDAVDSWRVEQLEPGRRLLLASEMKLPGRLWLQFEIQPEGERSKIRQTTVFDPAGYLGLAYWYMLYPVHKAIFRAMLHGLRRATTQRAPETSRAHASTSRHPLRGVARLPTKS
jgi:uncharacterized protein YbjT (DUF2867 family)